MKNMNILLSSVGRRPYLVKWFKEALVSNGLEGQVIAADLDPTSPARAFADNFVEAPRVDDPIYKDWLRKLLVDQDIKLAISVNDFELSEWAQLSDKNEWRSLIRLSQEMQRCAEDKYLMHEQLQKHNILAPSTWLGDDKETFADNPEISFVTKGRFGSASRGLHFADSAGLKNAIFAATHEVTDRQGVLAREQSAFSPEELVIVQERIQGAEFGLDIVSDFTGNFAAVLARKKIAMRAGETDRAVTVDPTRFEKIAAGIAKAVPHPGLMDVDVIVNEENQIYVIDINPRFGGGYPFSHLAGARVPNAYVAWAAGTDAKKEWLQQEPAVTGGKYVEAVRVAEGEL